MRPGPGPVRSAATAVSGSSFRALAGLPTSKRACANFVPLAMTWFADERRDSMAAVLGPISLR